MADDNGYRIEARRFGLGRGMPPSAEDIARLQTRLAQAQQQGRPKGARSFRQVLSKGLKEKPASGRPQAGSTQRFVAPQRALPKQVPPYAGRPVPVKAARDRAAAAKTSRPTAGAGRRKASFGPQAKIPPGGLRHPGQLRLFAIRTAMRIILRG